MLSFPVEYSTLSAEALLQLIVNKYHLNSKSSIVYLKRGFNDTYLITSVTNKHILRVYKSNWRSMESMETEIKVLTCFQENNVSVSFPIKDKEGNFIQCIQAPEGIRHAVLFSYAEGKQVRKLSFQQAYLLGSQVGKMHLLTSGRSFGKAAFNYEIDILFENILRIVKPVLIDQQNAYDYIVQLQKKFLKVFHEADKAELAVGICHGDIQAENFHITDDAQITFFDFDFFGSGYLIYDLGVFIWYDHKNKPPEIIRSFLKGYREIRKLSSTEIKLLPYFSTLRALFQMSLYCRISDGKQMPLWPAQQVADFVRKVERWHSEQLKLALIGAKGS